LTSQFSLATDAAISYGEIARLNEALETEVQERTTQLTQANAWLADTLQQSETKLAEQMEIDRRRSRFFSALAHELRAPIQLLLGHAYLAVEEGSERLTSLQHNSLTVILKTCEHLRDLIGKVMDASKLDEGGMSIDAAPFDVQPLIDDTLNLSRGFLKNKSVQLACDCLPNLPQVVGDKTRIRQVLLNLLANACRFTDRGRVSVSAAVDGQYLVIGVTDTGTGIPADKLETIFEPYIQADALRSHGGAGLGLAISKQLVELHGGRLWVTSTVGSGSTFYFSLPTVMD
jgi:two-component system sensor histidine kinase ChiS